MSDRPAPVSFLPKQRHRRRRRPQGAPRPPHLPRRASPSTPPQGAPPPPYLPLLTSLSPHLAVRDSWARVYLARGCAAAIQSGAIAGDIGAGARGEVFWEALQLLALADPSDTVAYEAIRDMFGAPLPRCGCVGARGMCTHLWPHVDGVHDWAGGQGRRRACGTGDERACVELWEAVWMCVELCGAAAADPSICRPLSSTDDCRP
eukprot:185420-Chlamydomonas_euryale.AAC.2